MKTLSRALAGRNEDGLEWPAWTLRKPESPTAVDVERGAKSSVSTIREAAVEAHLCPELDEARTITRRIVSSKPADLGGVRPFAFTRCSVLNIHIFPVYRIK